MAVTHERDIYDQNANLKCESEQLSRIIERAKIDSEKRLATCLSGYDKLLKKATGSTGGAAGATLKRIKDILNSIQPIISELYTDYALIASDANPDTWQHNRAMLRELRNNRVYESIFETFERNMEALKSTPAVSGTLTHNYHAYQLLRRLRTRDIRNELERIARLVDSYINLKHREETLSQRVSRIKQQGVGRTLARSAAQRLENTRNKVKDKLGILPNASLTTKIKRVAGASVGIAGLAASAFLKSPGIAVASGAFMLSRQKKIEKEKAAYKKAINDVHKFRTRTQDTVNRFRQQEHWKTADRRLSFLGGGGKLKAKRNSNVIVGDNPGGVEQIVLKTPNGIAKGLTSGVTSLPIAKGNTLSVNPLSGRGISKVNPASFSQLGGGTGEDKTLSVEERQLSILEKIQAGNERFYNDQISRADDAENKGETPIATAITSGKSPIGDMAKKVESKGIFGAIGDTLKQGVMTALMAKLFSGGGAKAGGGLLSKIPFLGKMAGGIAPDVQKVYVTNPDGGGISDMIPDKVGGKGGKLLGKAKGLLGKIPGAGMLSKIGGSGIAKAVGSKLPLIGGLVAGGATLAGGGSMGEAAGSGIGAVAGGALGAIGGPLGMVAGSMAGEWIGKKLGGLFSKRDKTEEEKKKTEEELLKQQEEGQLGFWDKLSSSDNPFLRGIGDRISTATSAFTSARERGGSYVDSLKAGASGLVRGTNTARESSLMDAAKKAGITDPKELAGFMGQMSHESGGFNAMSEGKYSAESVWKLRGGMLAKKGVTLDTLKQAEASGGKDAMYEYMYGGRMGNTQAGDAAKFKGRGFVQLTGKDNYAKYGKMIGVDLVKNPELAADPKIAEQIAVAYWKNSGAGTAAKAGDLTATRRAVNGGVNGLADANNRTQSYYAKFTGKEGIGNIPAQIAANAPVPVSPTTGSPVPKQTINTYNSNIEQSKVELAQAKAQKEKAKPSKGDTKNTTVVNNNMVASGGGKSGNVNVSSGDSTWVTLLMKGYSV